MISSLINSMLSVLLVFGRYLLLFAMPVVVPLLVSFVGFYIYWRHVRKLPRLKGESQEVGYGNFLKRIFWDFPKQWWYDQCTRDPDFFPEKGVHIIAGEQGKGKTSALVWLLLWFKKRYPKVKTKTNFGYKHQDGEINHWTDLTQINNGIYGEIMVLDEIQNWFSSLQSKDFPPEMLTELTQLRKQRACIFGTSQVFNRVAKPIREQTHYIYEPITLFGCLTIVRKFKPTFNADGVVENKNQVAMWFFVHNAELRDSFDTYHKIQKMVKQGFKEVNHE